MDNASTSPQNNDEPQPDPGGKTNYPVTDESDEPEEEIVKMQYPVESE
jgi:hypothetical protein